MSSPYDEEPRDDAPRPQQPSQPPWQQPSPQPTQKPPQQPFPTTVAATVQAVRGAAGPAVPATGPMAPVRTAGSAICISFVRVRSWPRYGGLHPDLPCRARSGGGGRVELVHVQGRQGLCRCSASTCTCPAAFSTVCTVWTTRALLASRSWSSVRSSTHSTRALKPRALFIIFGQSLAVGSARSFGHVAGGCGANRIPQPRLQYRALELGPMAGVRRNGKHGSLVHRTSEAGHTKVESPADHQSLTGRARYDHLDAAPNGVAQRLAHPRGRHHPALCAVVRVIW